MWHGNILSKSENATPELFAIYLQNETSQKMKKIWIGLFKD